MRGMPLLLVVALGTADPAWAQDSMRVQSGARLRVLHAPQGERERTLVGNLLDADSDVLRLHQNQEVQTLRWDQVRRVQVSVKSRSSRAETTGAVIGGLLGGVLFRWWADQSYADDRYNGAGAATVGVPAGAVAGYLIGKLVGAERWQAVEKGSLWVPPMLHPPIRNPGLSRAIPGLPSRQTGRCTRWGANSGPAPDGPME